MKHLNVRAKTIRKILRQEHGGSLYDTRFGSDFLDFTPKAQREKKIDKLDFIKFKNFCA